MNKRKLIALIIAPLFLSVTFIIFYIQPKKLNFSSPNVKTQTFIESEGNSKILKEFFSQNQLYCKYKIGNEQHPRLGFGIEKTKDQNFFNIKGFDFIEFELNPDSTNNFSLCLLFDIPKFTLQRQWWTHLYKVTDISVKPSKSIYRIPVKELTTPVWWYAMHRIGSDEFTYKFDLKRLKGIVFTNYDLAPRGAPLQINIKNITFKKSLLPILYKTLITLFIYALLLFIILNHRKKNTTIAYEKIPIQNNQDIIFSELSQFLGKNYHDVRMSLNYTSEKSGIPVYKIRQLLKEKYGHTFKQHLTNLRINEAKRLIKETDRQIIEISKCVGYEHISTFNHLFKKETKYTPIEYRESCQNVK